MVGSDPSKFHFYVNTQVLLDDQTGLEGRVDVGFKMTGGGKKRSGKLKSATQSSVCFDDTFLKSKKIFFSASKKAPAPTTFTAAPQVSAEPFCAVLPTSRGLQNLGQTCYLNTCIQAINANSDLRVEIIQHTITCTIRMIIYIFFID